MPAIDDASAPPDLAIPMAWTVALSCLGALAAQLRANGKLRLRQVIGAVVTSGVAAVIVFWLLLDRMHDSVGLHIGVSALAGLGGASTIDFMLAVLRARAGSAPPPSD